MNNWIPRQSDLEWTRDHFDSLNDGAFWGIPRNNSIWRIDKIARVLTCIHGPKDDMFANLTTVCKALKYTTAYAPEQLAPEIIQKHLPVTLDGDYGMGKTVIHTDRTDAKMKFVWREITDSDRATYAVNLALLPKEMLFTGKPTPCCDFCCDLKPIVTYAASKLTSGEVRDCWRWLSCKDCHDAITRNDFDLLEQRCFTAFTKNTGRRDKTARFAIKLSVLKFHKESIRA